MLTVPKHSSVLRGSLECFPGGVGGCHALQCVDAGFVGLAPFGGAPRPCFHLFDADLHGLDLIGLAGSELPDFHGRPEPHHAASSPAAPAVTSVPVDYDFDEINDDEDDVGDACGRWQNGRLGSYCSMAGTEFCDFECPYGD